MADLTKKARNVIKPDRGEGTPHRRGDAREAGRMGENVTRGGDVPKQGKGSVISQAAQYKLGPPKRPNIKHDNGHLDDFQPRRATVEDYANLTIWRAKLAAAESLRPDLIDGTAAYRHFLEGDGRDRRFSYERYVMNDTSGRVTLRNAILSIQWGVLQLHRDHRKSAFSLAGSPIACGSKKYDGLFPYPATENWQKTIGAHKIWLSGDVTVTESAGPGRGGKYGMHFCGPYSVAVGKDGAILVRPGDWVSKYSAALHGGDVTRVYEYGRLRRGEMVPLADPNRIVAGETIYHIPTYETARPRPGDSGPHFDLVMTLHAEDRYNFNPGDADIATGTPDSANGAFELTGLGRQFMHYATLVRRVSWRGFKLGVAQSAPVGGRRHPQPARRGR